MSRALLLAIFLGAIGFACPQGWAQSNDGFANRLTLTGASPVAVSNNLHATREVGEPGHAGASAGRSLWYTWTAPTTGTVTISTYSTRTGTPPLSTVAVYTGNSYPTLSEVASSNNLAQLYYVSGYLSFLPYSMLSTGTSVSVPVTAGTVYQIAVDTVPSRYYNYPDDGTTVLAIDAPPTIVAAANVTVASGAGFSYSVATSAGATAFAASNLPAGLVLNTTTGLITGTPTTPGTYAIGLSATGPGGTGTATLTVRVTDPVPAAPVVPVLYNDASTRGYVGASFSFSLGAYGDPTTYTATNLPAGLSLNASNGQISGTPTATGTFAVPVTATGPGGTGTATLTILIDIPPLPILVGALTVVGTTGTSFNYNIYNNLSGYSAVQPTSYSASNLPPGLTCNTTSGSISGTPTQAEIYTVPISATNAAGTRQGTLTIKISDPVATPAPTAGVPVLTGSGVAYGSVGTAFSQILSASGVPTSFTASGMPPGLTFNSGSGVFGGTPVAAGTFPVAVSATNAYGTSTGTLTITIFPTAAAQTAALGNPQPIITSPASAMGYTGKSLGYAITAFYPGTSYNDPQNTSPWTFTATGLPPGMSLTTASSTYGQGVISGTPTQAGVYRTTISVTCPANTNYYSSNSPLHPASTGTAVVTFTINAGPAPVIAPVITTGATVAATAGVSFSSSLSVTNSPTSYAASGLPPGLAINAGSGSITGTPTTGGTYQTAVSATNAAGVGTATLTFIVAAQGPLPFITSSAAASGTVGSSFSYYIYTSNSSTGYSASNLPPGLTFSTSSGAFSGTPTQAGVYTVPISATNGTGTANATLTITIRPVVTQPPAITSYNVGRATVGQSFYYYIATDVSATSYGASNLPPGLTYDAASGLISGTPTATGTYTVPLSATNAVGTGTATLTLIVSPASAPVFASPCALTAVVGQSFSSTVFTTNSTTSYTFSGLPTGITQSSATPGLLSGTPTQAGTYAVTVSASYAGSTTSATLTITVQPAVTTPPVITSTLGATAYVGQSFNYVIQSSVAITGSDVGGLPAGLTFTPGTRTISGKPTTAGNYTVTLYATNSVGSATAKLNLAVLTVASSPPLITSAPTITALRQQAFFYQIITDSPATSYSAGSLPSGVSLDTATGLLSGKLAATGTYTIPITVTGNTGQSQATLTLTVAPPILPVFTQPAAYGLLTGQAFSGTITTNANSNYSTTASPLPTGLVVNSSSGTVSGTPTTAGSWLASTSESTDYGTVYGQTLFTVAASAPVVPVITSQAGAGLYVGLPFLYQLQATNSPVSFATTGLPAGLTLDTATGRITGTPTTTGTSTATVTATNTKGTSANTLVTFTVTSATAAPIQITSAAAVAGAVGSPLSYTLTTSSASPSYTYPNNLPPGLSMSTSAGVPVISGTPSAAGTYATSLRVSNAYSSSYIIVTFNIFGTPPGVPVFNSAAGAAGRVGDAFSYTVTANNGPTSFTAASLPPGLTFNSSTQILSGAPTAAGTYSIALSATNPAGTGNGTLTLAVAGPTAPILTSSGNALERAFNVGDTSSTASTWYVNATNAVTSYSASGLPPGLSLNTSTGQITGTLTTAGTYPVAVSASNASGTANAVITYVVSPQPPPVILYMDASLVAFTGVPISTVSLYTTGSPTSYSTSGLPPGLALNTTTGYITGTPTAAGTYAVNLAATNAAGSGTAVWTVVVKDASVLYPRFSSINAMIGGVVGQSIYPSFSAYDYYNSSSVSAATAITVSGLPPGCTVSSSGNNYLQLGGTPTTAGTYPLTVTATAPGGATTTAVCQFVISPAPAPTITSAAGTLGNLNNAFGYSIYATNTVTSYSTGTLPPGLTLNATSGYISGKPTTTGTFAVPVSATGPYGTASAVITVRVDGPLYGGLPVITSAAAVGSQQVFTGNSFFYYYSYATSLGISYALAALNSPTSWTATDVPAGMVFNPYTGVLSGQPTTIGTFLVPVSATNAAGTVNATLTVISTSFLAVPNVPLASAASVGTPYVIQASPSYLAFSSYPYNAYPYFQYDSVVSPPAPMTYSAAGLPPGLTINSYNGYLSGTPTVAGTYPITVTVTSRAVSSSTVMTLAVAATPPAVAATSTLPLLTSAAQAAGFVGMPMKYTLYASSTASYAATGLPTGLSLNASTGVISGTPTAAGSWPVTVSATNAAGGTQATLAVTVDAAPPAPTLSNSCAATSSVGVFFSYGIRSSNYSDEPSPTAYAATGLPGGLTLNTTTGYISGTPTGSAGTYAVPITAFVGPVTTATGVLTIIMGPALAPTTPVMGSPAGALGLLGNPFYYATSDPAFAPTAALPDGLTYNPVTGVISGYPTVSGTYVVPMAAGGSGNGLKGSGTVRSSARRRNTATVRKPGRTPTAAPEGSDNPTAVLTIRVITPDLSLPRLVAQPTGGSAMEGGGFSFTAAAVGVPDPVYQWNHNGVPLTGATAPGLALASLQTADSGRYTLTVSNTAGSVASADALLVVRTTYARWQADHFTTQEIAAGLADDNVSSGSDGVSNLLKYALDLDPRIALTTALPVTVSRPVADGLLQIEFDRDAGRTDIEYIVESSPDLGSWTAIAANNAGTAMTSFGAASVTEVAATDSSRYHIKVKATPPTGQQQFLRLRVVRP